MIVVPEKRLDEISEIYIIKAVPIMQRSRNREDRHHGFFGII